jgi:hypothetical protein
MVNNSINLYLRSPNADERILNSRVKNEENSNFIYSCVNKQGRKTSFNNAKTL